MPDLSNPPRKIRAARFWKHVEKTETCWNWAGRLNPKGYGIYSQRGAHQASFRLSRGEVPSGLEIDHTCRNRRCVNPDHLEAVTHEENIRRSLRDACRNGHPYTPENVQTKGDGTRICKTCSARAKRRHRNTTSKRAGHRLVFIAVGDWRCKCGHPLGESQAKARKAAAEHTGALRAEDLAPRASPGPEWAPTA